MTSDGEVPPVGFAPGPDAVTVVVVAWRSGATLDRCLASVVNGTAGPGSTGPTVLVVDNEADAATHAVLDRWAGRVQVHRAGANLGFAGGVAAALEVLRTPLVLLLNDDARLAPDALRLLLGTLHEAGPGCAAVQPAVRLAGTHPALAHTTGTMVTPDGFGYDRDWLRPWPVGRDGADEPFGVCGAAALLRTGPVREVGGMDASLFLYYEDTDLSWRLRLAGYSIAFCPRAVVDHEHSASSQEGSDLAFFHSERNRLLVLARNASWRLALGQWLRHPLTTASWAVRTPAATARTGLRLRVLASALRRLPAALRRRRADDPRRSRRMVETAFATTSGPLPGYRA